MKPILNFVRFQHADGRHTIEAVTHEPITIPAGTTLRLMNLNTGAVAAVVSMLPSVAGRSPARASTSAEPAGILHTNNSPGRATQ